MTAVVILLILASLAATFMIYGTGRARMNNAVFDVAALISTAQLNAMSRGTPHYIIVRKDEDDRILIHLIERPDANPPIADWEDLDLTAAGPESALQFDDPQADGTFVRINAFNRGRLVLGSSTGADASGVAFLDLDSPRIPDPLPAPFNNLPTTTADNPVPARMDMPTPELMHGCSFCVTSSSGDVYGIIRFNSNGSIRMMTGVPQTGGVLAFMPNLDAESAIVPRLLTIAAPSGAVNVF
jgi:hypothetical protein